MVVTMKKISKSIILISDSIDSHENSTIGTRTLEMAECSYFDTLIMALKEITSNELYVYNNLADFEENIEKHKNDLVFSIYSGIESRNRKSLLPALCEINGIRYLGGDIYTQTLCQNKYLSKLYLKSIGFKVPFGIKLTDYSPKSVFSIINYPAVIKPNYEGGSIGISSKSLVNSSEEAIDLYKKLIIDYKELLLEEYIPGNEVNILIWGYQNQIYLCEPYKMTINGNDYFDNYIYGYEDKKMYQNQTDESYINIKSNFDNSILELAEKLFRDLDKVDILRIDGRLFNNEFYVIELSPDAYINDDSNFAQMFSEYGFSYSEMLYMLLDKINQNTMGNASN